MNPTLMEVRMLRMTFILVIGYAGGLMMGTAWAKTTDCTSALDGQLCIAALCGGEANCSDILPFNCTCDDRGVCYAGCDNNPPPPCNNPGPQPPLQAEPCGTGSHAECECVNGDSKCSCVVN